MNYPVPCECGKVYQIAAALAGSRYRCPCGRELVVPALSQLKAAAGERVLSPEVRVGEMLRLGMLPQESRCLICGTATPHICQFWVICERVIVKRDPSQSWWGIALFYFIGLLALLLLLVRGREREYGTDVRFRLPLRVCPSCSPDLADRLALRRAVLAVPVYADLFDKYPNAELALDAEQKGVDLSARGGT